MILTYHKIALEAPTMWWVTADTFWRQMEQLTRYQVVLLDEYNSEDPRQVVITFDGVYDGVYHYALPILRKFGYPFELFIVGNAVGLGNEFDQSVEPAARFADRAQLGALVQQGGRLQWHSRSHQDLMPLDQGQILHELEVPDQLQAIDPQGFKWFAYPHGKSSPEITHEVIQRFRGAVACDDGRSSDPYKWPRVTVTSETSFSKSTVSLIIANYNYGRFAAEAIESALAQTVVPKEILFIDDCSQDGSMEIADRYNGQITIVRNEQNFGITDNFNKAVSLTTGEYICFLGADNRFRSDYVEQCQRLLDQHPSAAVAYTDMMLFGPRAEVLAVNVKAGPMKYAPDQFIWRCQNYDEVSKRQLKTSNFIHGSSMYRRKAFQEVGGYRKSGKPEDHDLFLRMIEQGWEAIRCPMPLLEYRQHSNDQANTQLNNGLELAYLKQQLRSVVEANLGLKAELSGIHTSFSWEVLESVRRLKARMFPAGSRRRLVYLWMVHGIRIINYEGRRVFVRKAAAKLLKLIQGERAPTWKVRDGIVVDYGSGTGSELPTIDIIVVTYNSVSCVSRCLESIYAADYPKEHLKLFVVDNHSDDNTVELLERLKCQDLSMEIIRSESNVGFGSANNKGVQRGRAKCILLLNPDAELNKDTLRRLVGHAVLVERLGFGAWEPKQQPYEHPKVYDPVTLETEWVSGACCLILREAFERVGGFDENIFLYGEDVDLSWRLRAEGYKLQAVSEAEITHDSYAGPGEIKSAQFCNSVVSNGILRHKYGQWTDIVLWYLMFAKLIVGPPSFPGARTLLLRNASTAITKSFAALKARMYSKPTKGLVDTRFEGWNYEVRRDGAFYKSKPRQQSPLVSVIIRTMDRPFYLREALQAVRNQTYQNIEVIVVDDGNVKAKRILEDFRGMKICYIPGEGKLGRCKAGNVGLAQAKGNYINFLDEDDLWFADHVDVLVRELEAASEYGAAYSEGFQVETELVSESPFQYKEWTWNIVHRQTFDRSLLKEKNYIPINCLMFSRGLYHQYGGFDENLSLLEDWELWNRYARKSNFLFVPKTTCLYRVPKSHPVSASRQQALDEAYPLIKRKFDTGYS